ncbi:ABC transporter ATP-binding protein [Tatumella citrea]|uniref:Sulfonate ABC transporter ATP-binding protein n=1 Tax=Tatumella citrea TaxID=53336 RepID=A0A1Y0LHZ1_TATCI|nr:ABC transporter ATP-binding protein [Tatumella citrea]ARU93663.1 sulfonate ABC transporter ATP-binding protein [Tatumella citrea]ARU97701.1 sulfonate ABC transporter ATP-binding protein [Tatumella citrea]
MAQISGQLAPPLVSVQGLSRQYAGRTVLSNIQLELQQGEFVALLGRSGSGKSTLLKALAGLDSRATGSGELQVPENFSVAFQDSRLLPWLRVLDNIVLGDNSKSFRREGLQVLAGVGLAGRETNWPSDLSGGEQQRAALARCLVRKPALLLADEPFGALDALTRLNMQELLRRLCHQYQLTVLLVTHDVDEAIALAQRVIVLDQGGISLELTIGQQSARQPEQHEIYRQQLLKALGVSEPTEL